MSEQAIIERREQLARTAMREALENQQAEDSVELFIQHHLEEIESTYWQKHFGTYAMRSCRSVERHGAIEWDESEPRRFDSCRISRHAGRQLPALLR